MSVLSFNKSILFVGVGTCKSMVNAIMFKKRFKTKKFFGIISLNRSKFRICLVLAKLLNFLNTKET